MPDAPLSRRANRDQKALIATVKNEEKLRALIQELRQNPEVVGIWLGGSRSKGYASPSSDYDVWVFLTEDAYAARQRRGAPRKHFDGAIEVYFTHLGELARHLDTDSESLDYHYMMVGTEPLFDKSGELEQLVADLGAFPIAKQRDLVTQDLNAYCNAFFRSVKAEHRGDHLAALLQAGRSIDHLLGAMFALHERFKPFVEYLPAEVPQLVQIPWRERLLGQLLAIASTADIPKQQGLERDVEGLFRRAGYGAVFEAWEETAGWRWREAVGSS
jgi:predicted nucleotidyltransferase